LDGLRSLSRLGLSRNRHRVGKPDRIARHPATTCRHCEPCLTDAMVTGEERRQVFDPPQPHLEVTEHRAVTYGCHHCRGATTAAFPEMVTAHVQYGPRLRATAIYLNVQHVISEDRVCEDMADLFATASPCPASVVAWIGKAAEVQAPVLAHIAVSVVAAKVHHLDETDFRIGGKTRWLHSASTAVYTHYRVGEKRGDVPRTMADGVIIHDHFMAYYALRGAQHALCNAHHPRELQALIKAAHSGNALVGAGRPALQHPPRMRFLHLVRGNSKRLRVTLVMAPPDTRTGEVGGREHADAPNHLR